MFYTGKKLRILHRTSGYSFVKALNIPFLCADGSLFDTSTFKSLEKIWEDSRICAELASICSVIQTYRRLNRTQTHSPSASEQYGFEWSPVIQVVDVPTHLCNASFFRNEANKEILKYVEQKYSPLYLGPNVFAVDQQSLHTSKEVKEKVEPFRTCLEKYESRQQARSVSGKVSCLLRLTYERSCVGTSHKTSEKECMQLAVFLVNCT